MTPNSRAAAPRTRTAGRTSTGPSVNTPRTTRGPEADQRQAVLAAATGPWRTTGDAGAGQQQPDDATRPTTPDRSTATSRRAAIGRTRLARTAGTSGRQHADAHAHREGRDDRRRRDHERAARDVEAAGGEQGPQPERQPDPAARPTAAATTPTTTDSSTTERSTWPRRAPDGPQHGQVLHPLGHHDREGVVDDERPDEQGDVGERHQELVEEGQVLLEVGLLVGGVLLAGQRLEARAGRGDLRSIRARSADVTPVGRRRARCRSDRLGEQLLGGGVVGGDQRRAGDAVEPP